MANPDSPKVEIHRANPGVQEQFLASSVDDLFIGGEKGNGKSWLLLQENIYDVEEPDGNAILFRRTFPDLEDLIHKALKHFAGYAPAFNESKHLFTFPSGYRLKFSHLQHVKDIYNHTGQEYTLVEFDELPNFPKLPVLFMLSCLRSTNPRIKKRMRSSGNPAGEGVLWVKARYIDALEPFEIGWFKTHNDKDIRASKAIERKLNFLSGLPDGDKVKAADPELRDWMSRQWMPGIRAENTILNAADPGYESRLEQLPEEQKRAFKYGIWDTVDKPFQLIKTKWFSDAINGKNKPSRGLAAMGADYAESGDMCTLANGVGGQLRQFKEWPGMDGLVFGDIIFKEAEQVEKEHGAQYLRIGVDSVGPGTVLYHYLRKTRFGDRIDPIRYKDPKFSDSFKDYTIKMKFDNLRSQMAWKLREDFQYGRIDLSPLMGDAGYYDNMHLLQEEVLAHTYSVINGFVRIVSKDVLRKADGLNRSPDRFDALMIWNWVRERARAPQGPRAKSLQEQLDIQSARQTIRRERPEGLIISPDGDPIVPDSWQAG